MLTRDKLFYDIVAKGLASMGYTGSGALSAYVNDMFASKYNAEQTFAQMGFPLNPSIPIRPTYEQIDAVIRPHTMGSYVDIDSDGPTKSTDGFSLKIGELPTNKHEVVLSRKVLREMMMLTDAIGNSTPEIEDTVVELLFNGLDDLLGGNYNTFRYQRNQIVSNGGKFEVNAANNPLGIAMTIDFGVPTKNFTTSAWYTKDDDGTVTQADTVGDSVDPIKVMKLLKRNAEQYDYAPAGHWECSKTTYEDLVALPYFRQMYALVTNPTVTDKAQQLALGNLQSDEVIKAFIESLVGARIEVIDFVASVEKYDKTTKAMGYTYADSFNEGVLVYVPDGAIGDAQFGKPIFMETPGARTALYDGGRTLIRQVFNDETMTQVIKSEWTGLIVPNKTRWMYYLTIKG